MQKLCENKVDSWQMTVDSKESISNNNFLKGKTDVFFFPPVNCHLPTANSKTLAQFF